MDSLITAGPFPTILHVHGGPEAVMIELYVPASQSWIDHGFAFLSINYRGSTTFGRQPRPLGSRRHSRRARVADQRGHRRSRARLRDGMVVRRYLTLQALGTRPAPWAGGMAGIAVADWAIAHEDTTETLRGIRAARFGSTPQEQPERYAASSPITYAKDVQAPVLIIQGRNDTRTPRRIGRRLRGDDEGARRVLEKH